MKIFVKAKTGAKKSGIKNIGENKFEVSVKELPVDGKANEAVVAVIAEHFGTSKSCVKIISGHSSKQKIVEILR